jgi:hypothetical protein
METCPCIIVYVDRMALVLACDAGQAVAGSAEAYPDVHACMRSVREVPIARGLPIFDAFGTNPCAARGAQCEAPREARIAASGTRGAPN